MSKIALTCMFQQEACPAWDCPACGNATMKIKPGTFHFDETLESKKLSSAQNQYWDPEEISYIFSSILICESSRCGEVVACSGSGGISQEWDEEGVKHIALFSAKYFNPPLRPIQIPQNCPTSVRNALIQSFSLFLNNPGAAANAIRISVENLLTEFKVPTEATDKKGKTIRLTLHARLQILPSDIKDHLDALMAIKWLGNAGSHQADSVSTNDIDSAYKVIEYFLEEIYDSKANMIAKIAAKITENFGNKPK